MRMKLALLALILIGCHLPAPSQAPLHFWVAHASPDVVRLAAQAVAAAGFDVTKADTAGGVLMAVREVSGDGNALFLRCEQGGGQRGAPLAFTSKVTVSVTARDSGGGALVGISAEVPYARAPFMGLGGGTAQWTCWSSGGIERRIVAALG